MPNKEAMDDLVAVSGWKTTDGEVFDNKGKAAAHQSTLNFRDWYESGNEIYAGHSRVDLEDMSDWLETNKAKVYAFLENL